MILCYVLEVQIKKLVFVLETVEVLSYTSMEPIPY